jgi:hypothetical protein
MCDHPVGRFSGVHVGDNSSFAIDTAIGCGRWDCPDCGAKKLKQLMKRIFEGQICNIALPSGFRSKYFCKFLTLTVPGKGFRDSHTADDAFVIISHYWDLLLKSVRKSFGRDFLYFRVVERQQDGYPHYHVLMVGRSVAPKNVLDYIKRMWSEVYGMGFFVKLNLVKSLENSVTYLCKYLTKHFGAKGSLPPRRVRLFSSSRRALAKLPKTVWAFKRVVVGSAVDITPSRITCFDLPVLDGSDRRTMFGLLFNWILSGGRSYSDSYFQFV